VNELALFAGAGGGLLGGRLLGWTPVCAVEIEEYPRNILLARQRDGCLPAFPVWDDVRTFNGHPWHGVTDVITGGFPCTDISSAGRGQGLAGERSGLWFEMLRIIGEVRPPFVFAENSPYLRTRGLGVVIEGLTGLGYDVRWCVLGAWHTGNPSAPHRRNRMWIYASDPNSERVRNEHRDWREASPVVEHDGQAGLVADADGIRLEEHGHCKAGKSVSYSSRPGPVADANSSRLERHTGVQEATEGRQTSGRLAPPEDVYCGADAVAWWASEPDVGRVVNGVAARLDRKARLQSIGNGQVPAVAALAWSILHGADR